MEHVKKFNLRPGDKILVPKSVLGLIQHHAVYVGRNIDDQHLVAENKAGLFVRLITADMFFFENPDVTKVVYFHGNEHERIAAVNRALSELGQPYDLLNYNCEHFANYVHSGRKESIQVGWAVVGLLALLAFLAVD